MASDREIVSTRVFDAPRERVWEVFRDPERLKQWWGPKGFTNTIQSSIWPGGKWRLIMRGERRRLPLEASSWKCEASRLCVHEEPIHRPDGVASTTGAADRHTADAVRIDRG